MYMENQNRKSNKQIKETIVLFSNNYTPLVDVYNFWSIVNKLQCSNWSQHKKQATTCQLCARWKGALNIPKLVCILKGTIQVLHLFG
jgi:hypothetical protein